MTRVSGSLRLQRDVFLHGLVADKYTVVFEEMIEMSLPLTVKSLSIFEDFNPMYAKEVTRESVLEVDLIRIPNASLGKVFAQKSLDLEHLYASFLIDAWHFSKHTSRHGFGMSYSL